MSTEEKTSNETSLPSEAVSVSDEEKAFPPPPKAATGTAYRTPIVHRASDPTDEPVVVQRPERPVEPIATPPKKPLRAPLPLAAALISEPRPRRNVIGAFIAERPRLSGLLGALLFGYFAIDGVISDAATRRAGVGWVNKPGVLPVFAGFAVAGLWLFVFGVPIQDEGHSPPDWWKYGLILAVIATLAGFSPLAALLGAR